MNSNAPSFKLKPHFALRAKRLQVGALALPLSIAAAELQAQVLEEVVVTATRRSESVQDIPINITAVSGEQITRQGFDDFSELAAFVPGINVVDEGGRDGNRIVARGLNAGPAGVDFGKQDGGGTVATYVGELPFYIDFRLADLERVEVLLGPQGTLYGAGTMGGAIRYIPTKPQFDEMSFSLRGDAYGYSEGDSISSDVGVTFNFPVSDTLAIRGSLDRLDDQGFMDYPYVVQEPGVSIADPDFSDPAARAANLAPQEDVNFEEIVSGKIAVRWNPIDEFDATLTYYFQDTENGGRSRRGLNPNVPTGDYESDARVVDSAVRDSELLSLEIVADLGFAELTSATGIGESEAQGQRDQTDLLITLEYSYEIFPSFTAFTAEDEERETFTQELRLVSTSDGPLNWIVGAFYSTDEYREISSEFTPNFAAYVNDNFGFGYTEQPNDIEYFAPSQEKLEELAFYGEIGYDITQAWNVTLGVRYYDYEFESADQTLFPHFEAPGFNAWSLGQIDEFLPLQPYPEDDPGGRAYTVQEFDGDLFKFNTSYDFNDDVNAYFTFSQGYRYGASNGGVPCPDEFVDGNQGQCFLAPGQEFGPNPGDIQVINELEYVPDTVDNYELGIKSTLMDGRLTANAAIYYMDWQDIHVASASVNANLPITVNGGSAEVRGFEFSGSWLVNESFALRGMYAYTNAELAENVTDLVRSIDPPGFGSTFEDGQDGDQLPGSPENQFSIFGTYSMPLKGGAELVFDGGYAWQDEVLTIVGARGGSRTLDAYGRATFNASYMTDTWTVTLYCDNCFDDVSESSAQSRPAFNQSPNGQNVRSHRANVLPPLTVGLRGTIDF